MLLFEFFKSFFLKILKDQRGEVGAGIAPDDSGDDDDPAQDPTDQPDDDDDLDDVVLDIDGNIDSDDDDDDIEDDDKKDTKDKKPPADKGDKDANKDKKDAPSVEDLQKQLKQKEDHIKNLNRALHESRSKKKAGKDKQEGEPLSQEQLVAILHEHKDDPATLLNIVEYVASQAASGAKKDAINETEIAQKVKEVNTILLEEFPDLSDESSMMRTNVDETKRYFNVESHPFGDLFGTAVNVLYNLKDIVQAAEERGKEAALKEKADHKRKKSANDTNLAPKGKGKGSLSPSTLSSRHVAVAKQMGMTPSQAKIYATLVNKKSA